MTAWASSDEVSTSVWICPGRIASRAAARSDVPPSVAPAPSDGPSMALFRYRWPIDGAAEHTGHGSWWPDAVACQASGQETERLLGVGLLAHTHPA
ncbi:MAG: hypothetical protein ABSA93_05230 [Streptosporangiaceae bacterium]